jgi:hypothetical protein
MRELSAGARPRWVVGLSCRSKDPLEFPAPWTPWVGAAGPSQSPAPRVRYHADLQASRASTADDGLGAGTTFTTFAGMSIQVVAWQIEHPPRLDLGGRCSTEPTRAEAMIRSMPSDVSGLAMGPVNVPLGCGSTGGLPGPVEASGRPCGSWGGQTPHAVLRKAIRASGV